jgi:predicted Zn-dependent protease
MGSTPKAAILAALPLLVSACAINPATGQRQFSLMSEEQEIALGRESDVQVRKEMGVYDDRALQEYVSGIGMRLASVSERPNLPWQFTVVDAPAINAFALPGGFIYITRGIMAFLDDEAQLAGVLGHEIGHVTARHSVSQYSKATGAQIGLVLGSIFVPGGEQTAGLAQTGLGLLFLKNSRDDEAQADELGVRYASRGGWDPAGVPQMLTTLARVEETSDNRGVPNWLQTHPQPADRVRRVQAAVQQAELGAERFATDRDGYLRRIDGIMYGDNPDQGVVRGRQFLHRALRFAVEFPAGWTIQNAPAQVVAREPGGGSVMLLETFALPAGRTIEDVARSSMQGAGFRRLSGASERINGLSAYAGTYQGELQGLGQVQVRAAHIAHNRDVYFVAGIAPIDGYARVEPAFSQAVRSFRPLTAAEAEAVRANRVGLYTAREGDTWQSIAEREGTGTVPAATLAIMNGHAVNEQPRPGERLKIVVAG